MTRITGALAQVYRPSSPHGILRPDTSTISIFTVTWYAPAAADWSRDVTTRRLAALPFERHSRELADRCLWSRLSLTRRSPCRVRTTQRSSIRSAATCSCSPYDAAIVDSLTHRSDERDGRERYSSTRHCESMRNCHRAVIARARYVIMSLSTRKCWLAAVGAHARPECDSRSTYSNRITIPITDISTRRESTRGRESIRATSLQFELAKIAIETVFR